MGGLDTPLLRVEVVGTITNVLYQTKGMTHKADFYKATRGVGRKDNGFMAQIGQGLSVGKLCLDVCCLEVEV